MSQDILDRPLRSKLLMSKEKYSTVEFIQSLINNTGKKDLMKIVNELGGWPVLQGKKWSGENFAWQKQEGKK